MTEKFSIGGLKEFAQRTLPPSSPLREIILSEPDVLDAQEFLGRLSVWLRLAGLEDRRSDR
jgi:hypothetical protein